MKFKEITPNTEMVSLAAETKKLADLIINEQLTSSQAENIAYLDYINTRVAHATYESRNLLEVVIPLGRKKDLADAHKAVTGSGLNINDMTVRGLKVLEATGLHGSSVRFTLKLEI